MLQFIIQTLFFAVSIGIIGAVYHGVLAYSPVLNWWFRFGARFEKKWFFDPVWGCVMCISGQLALWFYLVMVVFNDWASPGWPQIFGPDDYVHKVVFALFGLLTAICGAIFFAMIFSRIIKKLKNA